jgi:surface antigen
LVGHLSNGSTVYITCQTSGVAYATGGSPASDSIWDQLGPGVYVADYWISTPAVGTFSHGIPQCAAPAPPPQPSGNNLGSCVHAGTTIVANQYLSNGNNVLVMQGDGNLVAYTTGGKALWDSQTNGNPGARTVLQSSDGNLVVYSASGQPLWAASVTAARDSLCMQGDNNVVVYSPSGAALWATMTVGVWPRGNLTSGNGYPSGQCTWYAEDRAHNYIGVFPQIGGDARYWGATARANGWSVSTGASIGSVVVFQPGVDGAGGYGHVAWVTQFYPSQNRITIREMNFTGPGNVDTRSVTPAYDPGLAATGQPRVQYIHMNP